MAVINPNGTASLASVLIASNPRVYIVLQQLGRKLAADKWDPKLNKDAAWAAVEKQER